MRHILSTKPTTSAEMTINDLPVVAFDRIIEYLITDIGFYEALRLREVNQLFDNTITRCLFDTSLAESFMSEREIQDTYWRAPLLSHFLIGQLKRRGRDNSLLYAIGTAIEGIGESITHSSRTALLICEAAGRKLGQQQCFRILEYVGEGRSVPPTLGGSPEPTEGRDDKATYIFCAEIIAGNYDRVVEMIESGSGNIHVASKYFDQPIHLAALFGRTEIAAYLIRRNEAVSTALANIRLSEYCVVIPYLISRSDIRIRGTALRIACLEGHELFVRRILEDMSLRHLLREFSKEELEMCLYAAAYGGNLNVLKLVFSAAEEPLLGGNTCKTKDPLDSHSMFREHLFFIAAKTLNVEVIQWTLSLGVDVNSVIGRYLDIDSKRKPRRIRSKHSALQHALMHVNRHYQNSRRERTLLVTVRYLLENGADPNLAPHSPLPPAPIYQAIQLGNLPLIEVLLQSGVEENVRGHFLAAVYSRNIEMIRYFLSRHLKKEPVDTESNDTQRAFNDVARHGPPEVLEYLITEVGLPVDKGTDIDNPVYCAMQYSNEATLEVLYRHGAREVNPMTTSHERFWRNKTMPYRKCSELVKGIFGLRERGGCTKDGSCCQNGCLKDLLESPGRGYEDCNVG